MTTQDNAHHQHEISTLAKGAGIVFFGTIIGTGLKYIFELIVARNLGADLFGVFFLGFTIYKILERVGSLGLPLGVLRYVSIFRSNGDNERIKGTILLSLYIVPSFGVFLAAVIVLFSNKISVGIFHESSLAPVLTIFAMVFVFSGLTEILTYSTLAFQTTKYKVLVRMIFEPGVRIVLVFCVFALGWKLLGVSGSFGISVVLGPFLALFFLLKLFPQLKTRETKPIYETRRILNFSWPLFFVGFFNLMILQITTLMLGNITSSEQVGIYGAAFRTAFLIPIILESFNSIFAPMISESFHKKEYNKLENLFKIVTKWIFTISFPITIILILFARQILRVWGEDYTQGYFCLVILCIGQLINCSVGPVGYMISMTGRSKLSLVNTTGILGVNIALSILLIPKYGIAGAAISAASSLVLINLVRLIEIFVILKIHPFRMDFFKPALAGAGSVLILTLLRFVSPQFSISFLSFLIGVLIVAISYSTILFLLGIEKEDRLIFERIRKKFQAKDQI